MTYNVLFGRATLKKKSLLISHMATIIIRPRRLSSRGSGFLLTKNRADQPRLSNVVQLRGMLPRVENVNKY